MAEQVAAPLIAPVTPEPVSTPLQVPQEDIISRATKVEIPKVEIPKEPQEEKFDYKEYEQTLNSIKDPTQKAILEKAYKSFQSGFNKKFQDLADIRKQFESKSQEVTKWTPEKLQQEINKQDFIESAKAVMETQAPANSNLTDSEYSMLSENEKAKIKQLDAEIQNLKKLNQQTLIQNQQENMKRLDESLKTKYANYDPNAIDIITEDLMKNRVQATREHIYKAYYHDENVRRAYELGRQDERNGISVKKDSASLPNSTANRKPEPLEPEKGENSLTYFKRIAIKNLAEQGK